MIEIFFIAQKRITGMSYDNKDMYNKGIFLAAISSRFQVSLLISFQVRYTTYTYTFMIQIIKWPAYS